LIAAGIAGSASMAASPRPRRKRDGGGNHRLHQLCEKGDRKACIRFGILIGRNEQRNADLEPGTRRLVLVRALKENAKRPPRVAASSLKIQLREIRQMSLEQFFGSHSPDTRAGVGEMRSRRLTVSAA